MPRGDAVDPLEGGATSAETMGDGSPPRPGPGHLIDDLKAPGRHADMLLTDTGTVLDVNRFSLEYTGVRWEDVVGLPFWDTVWLRGCSEGAALARDAVARARHSGGETVVEDLPYDVGSGQRHYVTARFLPLATHDGSSGRLLVTCYETTRRRRVEEANRHLAAVVESSGDAILTTARDRITSWNRGAVMLFGYTSEEIVGRPVEVLYPPEQLEELVEARRMVDAGKELPSLETVRLRKDGSPVEVSVTRFPMRDGTGRLLGLGAIYRDIGDRRRTEAALQAQRDHQAALLDVLRDGLVETDADGVVLAVSRQFCDMTGWSRDELVGRRPPYPWADPETPEPVAAAIHDVVAQGEARLEGRIVGPGGRRLVVEVASSYVAGRAGVAGVVSLVRNDTERVEAVQRLLEAERELFRVEQQERIARELQDRTLRRLFATGLAVEGVAQRVRDPQLVAGLREVVGQLDDVIEDIRRVIFGFSPPTER